MAVVVADAGDIEVDQAVAIKVAGEVGVGLVGVVVEGERLGLAWAEAGACRVVNGDTAVAANHHVGHAVAIEVADPGVDVEEVVDGSGFAGVAAIAAGEVEGAAALRDDTQQIVAAIAVEVGDIVAAAGHAGVALGGAGGKVGAATDPGGG